MEEPSTETWIVHCDGAWCNNGAGIAAIIESPSGAKTRYAARLSLGNLESSTNNTTEYEALLLGLRKMKALGHQNFIVITDSKVVRDHIEKDSEARKPELIEYLDAVRAMEKHFKGFDIVHIPRHMNDEADKLAKAASRKGAITSGRILRRDYGTFGQAEKRKTSFSHFSRRLENTYNGVPSGKHRATK